MSFTTVIRHAACWLAVCLLTLAVVQAAPDRLNDDVPSAFPDPEGALSISFGHQTLDLDGALNSLSTSHDYVKLGYMLNPHTSLKFRYGSHNLGGSFGLLSPIFDDADSATSYSFDLNLNMLNQPATPSDEEAGVAFVAGSAFGMGVTADYYDLDLAGLGQSNTLVSAYLVYTTDLTEEMRAHTYFSSGRISGDSSTGSVNRIAAGLDYTLVPGRRELTLLANGTLDVYNFRQPSFNTNRISRFDLGLRYRVAEDWFASVGFASVNDSENDASGSGIYANFNFVDMPSFPCDECEGCDECAETEQPEEEAPAEQALLPLTPGSSPANTPTLMANLPAAQPMAPVSETSIIERATSAAEDELTGGIEIPVFPLGTAESEPAGVEPELTTLFASLPPTPQHTPAGAVMIRPHLALLAELPLLGNSPSSPEVDEELTIEAASPWRPVAEESAEAESVSELIAANAAKPTQGLELSNGDD